MDSVVIGRSRNSRSLGRVGGCVVSAILHDDRDGILPDVKSNTHTQHLLSEVLATACAFVPALRPFRAPFGTLGASIILHDTLFGVKQIQMT